MSNTCDCLQLDKCMHVPYILANNHRNGAKSRYLNKEKSHGATSGQAAAAAFVWYAPITMLFTLIILLTCDSLRSSRRAPVHITAQRAIPIFHGHTRACIRNSIAGSSRDRLTGRPFEGDIMCSLRAQFPYTGRPKESRTLRHPWLQHKTKDAWTPGCG